MRCFRASVLASLLMLAATATSAGFYRVEKTPAGGWTLVDPSDTPFFAIGVDHVRYEGFRCEKTGESRHLEYNRRKYGSRVAWEKDTFRRLRAWGFNMLGSCPADLVHKGLPHIALPQMGNLFARRGGTYARCQGLNAPETRFPNVDHPEWERYCRDFAAKNLSANRDDRDLIGYFTDNELKWRCLDGFPESEIRRIAERYFRTTTEAIRAVDPNHLILGCRFAGLDSAAPVVWEVAAKYCDVLSVNCYPWVDIDREIPYLRRGQPTTVYDGFADMYRRTGRPFFVSEWGFSAVDGPCPCTTGGGQRFRTQAQRTAATLTTARTYLAMPFLVGYDFFMWVDEPREGIRPESPEDTAYGLLPEVGDPYPVAEALARLHANLPRWRASPPPAPREPPTPFSETAESFLRRSGFRGSGTGLAWDGEFYSITNGCGFELIGVLGAPDIFERVWHKGRRLGSFGAMLNFVANGRLTWIPLDKVLEAESETVDGRTRVRIRGQGGRNGILFAATLLFTVYPDRPWMVAEVQDVENLGKTPVEVKSFFFTIQSPFSREGNYKKRVRNLWNVANSDFWRADDGRVWGAESYARDLQVMHFWVDDKDNPHADAAVLAGKQPVALPPGGHFRPERGAVWICVKGDDRLTPPPAMK